MKAWHVVGGIVAFWGCLWGASEWWERAFATLKFSYVSPNGCYRIDQFRPYWILPSIFHPMHHPDGDPANKTLWLMPWGAPGFLRLYDRRTGELVGETDAYDMVDVSAPIWWGTERHPVVSMGLLPIALIKDCFDRYYPDGPDAVSLQCVAKCRSDG